MERLLETAYRILSAWRIAGGLRRAWRFHELGAERHGTRSPGTRKVMQGTDAGKVFY
jgi:hypothetical protein